MAEIQCRRIFFTAPKYSAAASFLQRRKSMTNVPDTLSQLESLFKKSMPTSEESLRSCHVCRHRNTPDAFHLFLIASKSNPKSSLIVSFCRKCLSVDQKNFILEKSIDPRKLNAEILVDLEKSYLTGLIEDGGGLNGQEYC